MSVVLEVLSSELHLAGLGNSASSVYQRGSLVPATAFASVDEAKGQLAVGSVRLARVQAARDFTINGTGFKSGQQFLPSHWASFDEVQGLLDSGDLVNI